MEYRGRRAVTMPAAIIYHVLDQLDGLVGDASTIIIEAIGEAAGKATREITGWETGKKR